MKSSVSNSTGKDDHFNARRGLIGVTLNTLLVLVFCNSCGSLPREGAMSSDALNPPVSWFEADSGHFLFNTSIDVMKNHFSGITIVKPLKNANYRVIMITETGLKILDMEFFPDTLPRVHYMMEQMDKKMLIRMLQKDISIMLMNQVRDLSPLWYENFIVEPSITAVYKVNGEKFFYILEPGQVHPSAAFMGKGRKFRVEATFFGSQNSGIDSLKLSHNNIDLSIRLLRINEVQ